MAWPTTWSHSPRLARHAIPRAPRRASTKNTRPHVLKDHQLDFTFSSVGHRINRGPRTHGLAAGERPTQRRLKQEWRHSSLM